jgi:benzoyl-CoA-dihydrodiol lyase
VLGPSAPVPASTDAMVALGASFWPLSCARDLDDAILHLRLNELDIGVLSFKTSGDARAVLAHDAFLSAHADHWLAREITGFWRRLLKRIDVTSRTLTAQITPGSCFAGTLAELTFACDRSFMLAGSFPGDNQTPAAITLGPANFGAYPMCNDLTRLQTRFLGELASVDAAQAAAGQALDADTCEQMGLITVAYEHIDWDEVRVFLEERASYSPDGLTGLEANLRFPGPETMETRIFGRLTAWQNWIFQRANASGPDGALKRYGTGQKAEFNRERV